MILVFTVHNSPSVEPLFCGEKIQPSAEIEKNLFLKRELKSLVVNKVY